MNKAKSYSRVNNAIQWARSMSPTSIKMAERIKSMTEKITLSGFIRRVVGLKKFVSPPRVKDYVEASPSRRTFLVTEDMAVPYSGHMKPLK